MSHGYVYILSNPSMPGLLKIGKTCRSARARADELYQTGVPTPFRVEYEVRAPDCDKLEADVHASLSDDRVNPDREFFRCDISAASAVIDGFQFEQVRCATKIFLPDYRLVHDDAVVDFGSFRDSVYEALNVYRNVPINFADVLYQIEGDELKPAIERQKEITESRLRKREEDKSALSLVAEL